MRAFIANLDCEIAWARAGSPGPHKALPTAVRTAVSEFSRRIAPLAGPTEYFLTLDDLHVGAPPEIAAEAEVLCWGQTGEYQGMAPARETDGPWRERLWHLRARPGAASACNRRDFALALSLGDEVRLEDVRIVRSLDELDAYLESAALGPQDSWVAKAPWSASGREKLKRRGRVVIGEQRAFAARLLRRYGWLLVEPWMERTADFGVAGIVDTEKSVVFPAHRLLCDSGGVFRGIEVDDRGVEEQLGQAAAPLEEAAWETARALRERGYRGAFGIDAFLYDDGGTQRLRAVCEINARLSFGHVARAIAEDSGGSCVFSL